MIVTTPSPLGLLEPGEQEWMRIDWGDTYYFVDGATNRCFGFNAGGRASDLFFDGPPRDFALPAQKRPRSRATVTRPRGWRNWLLPALCAVLTAIIVHVSFSPLFVASGTGRTVWGPALGQGWVGLIVSLTIVAVALARGVPRFIAFTMWFVVLGILTHRVVDASPDGVEDQWFLMQVNVLPEWAETDPEPAPCPLVGLPALCVVRGTATMRTLTVLPFVRMEAEGGPLA